MFDKKKLAVLKIRSKLIGAARNWLDQNGYVEVQGPTMIPAIGEWAGHFEVKYFDKKAYLAQGLHPYSNAFVASLGKIYTIAPTFRAEKSRTVRHLTEYWRIEVAQNCSCEIAIENQEKLLTHISHSLLAAAKEDLSYLNRSVKDLQKVETPFPRLSYDEVVDVLQKDRFSIAWGQRIDWQLENHLSLKFQQPFFITDFPTSTETLFFKSNPGKPELTLSFDLLAPGGYGEIGGGGQMVDKEKLMLRKMAEEKIEQNDQEWYMNLMRPASSPQSGFAIGIERLLQWICELGNIKEATAFPRSYDTLYP